MKPMRVAYIFTDIPNQVGTFASAELEGMAYREMEVELICLRSKLAEGEGADTIRRRFEIRSSPYFSLEILWAMLAMLVHRPKFFITSLWRATWDTQQNMKILLKTLAVFPKVCLFSYQLYREPVDQIHAFWASLPARTAWWISGFTDIPYATWAHAGADIYNKNHQTESALKTVLNGASIVMTCNRTNLAYFSKLLEPSTMERVFYHPHGIDLARFHPKQPTAASSKRSKPIRLFSVGRLTRAKGFHYAMEACCELAQHGLDFEYHLVGDGPLKEQLEVIARAGRIDSRIKFHGALDQIHLPALYREADIFLVPSIVGDDGARDGLPNVLLEAMACAVPAIGSNTVGIPEAIEDEITGLLVEPKNVSEISAAVLRIANDPELGKRMAAAALARVGRSFSRQSCMDQLAAYYRGHTREEIAAEKRTAGAG